MFQSTIRNAFRKLGYEIVRRDASFSPDDLKIIDHVSAFTMSGPERLSGLLNAVAYLVANRIDGEFVECGVWRGGSLMAAAFKLLSLGTASRQLHLFDTFEGMPPPSAKDRVFTGEAADAILAKTHKKEGPGVWAIAGLRDVQGNMKATSYPQDLIRFVQGKVEDTIPAQAPEKIALLRLDTDWYESTKHELIHLYPRLVPGGVLIIDDYGHWQGAKEAVDEYFASQKFKPLLNRLDYTGRLLIKPAQ